MEITTASGINNGDANSPDENEESNRQHLAGEIGQTETGSGDIGSDNGSDEDLEDSLPGATAGETVAENDSANAGAGIDYGGIGDDAGPITESTEEQQDD